MVGAKNTKEDGAAQEAVSMILISIITFLVIVLSYRWFQARLAGKRKNAQSEAKDEPKVRIQDYSMKCMFNSYLKFTHLVPIDKLCFIQHVHVWRKLSCAKCHTWVKPQAEYWYDTERTIINRIIPTLSLITYLSFTGVLHPNQKLACFVLYLGIINTLGTA